MATKTTGQASPFTTPIVIAVTGFATDTDAVAKDARLRSDHPLVLAHPGFFIEDGSTTREASAAEQRLHMTPIATPPAAWRCVKPVPASDPATGVQYEHVPKGQLLLDGDPRVGAYADHFEPIHAAE
jgi:hypothetical protein